MMKTSLLAIIAFLLFISPIFGAERAPIDVNLIIDGSQGFAGVKNEVTVWLIDRLDHVLATGDSVTVWNAGARASIVFSGRIDNASDKEAVRRAIRDFSVSGNNADFGGALQEAARRQNTAFTYTLLISSSASALTSTLSGPHANLLRFSRVQEFAGWRALTVGLNLDARVRNAAAAFFN